MPFPAVVDLDDIAAGRGGFKIQGENAGDTAGISVSAAGDVNGDGIDDVIVGAHYSDSSAGAAYVVFGRSDGFTSLVDLDAIAAGSGGFKIQGENEHDFAGHSVAAAGDVNGDGIDDLIVGAPQPSIASGVAYVVFGRTGGFATPVDLDAIATGSGGFKIQGENRYDYAGLSVSAAGDVNGDGIGDLIVGALDHDYSGRHYAGAAYVVFGRTGGFTSPVDLDDIAAGSGGFKIQGENAGDFAGASVSAAGDVNGDGIDDLIVGASRNYNSGGFDAGAAYVVFGRAGGFASPVDLAGIAASRGGFKILGENEGDYAGFSVSAAGDVNGDGTDDLIVGAPLNDSGGYRAGAAYVVFGRTGGFARPVDLDVIAAGRGGFKIQGENAGDYAGHSVSAAGDVNGDGIDDLIVGAPGRYGGTSAGGAYVVFGRTSGFASPVDLADIAAGNGGFKIQGENAGDDAGHSVSAAGDVNGDGIDDLIVGAPHPYASDGAGAAYVIFGRRDPLFTDGNDTRDLDDFDLSPFTLAQATHALGGDDVVTLSETQNLGLLFTGNAGDDTVTGSEQADRIRGDFGDDSLFGRGGDDSLWGTEGEDRLDGGAGADELNGGDERDILRGGDDGDHIYGRDGADLAAGGNGNDGIFGGEGNDRLLGGDGDDTLSGDAERDIMTGDGGADIFRFAFAGHSRPGAIDRITDFAEGDLLDLSRIDAVRGGADDAFAFIGDAAFTAAGQLRLASTGSRTLLEGNTLGDGEAEFVVALDGLLAIGIGDLLL
jgi:hypothetical protein